MKSAARLVFGFLLLFLCAGCMEDSGEDDFDPEFNPEREAMSFCKRMDEFAARFSKKTPEAQTKEAVELKQKLLAGEDKAKQASLGEVSGVVGTLSIDYKETQAGKDKDAVGKLKAQACQKAALAARPFLLQLVSNDPPLLELVRKCLTSRNEDIRLCSAKIIQDDEHAITAFATSLLRGADSFTQGAEGYDQFCKQGCVSRLLSLLPKEKRLVLFEKAAARSDMRMMGSVKARLTGGRSVPAILDIGGVHADVARVAKNYVVPLYGERFYKYSEQRGLATIIEDTWICVYLLPYLPEQRATDPEHKERWEGVVKRFEPVILELTDERENTLRNRLNLLAEGKEKPAAAQAENAEAAQAEKAQAADAKDILTRLPALEKLADELRAANKAQTGPALAPPPPAPGNF